MGKSLVVGLTGGFGTGKSTVVQFFRKLGAEVLDADEIAHKALKRGSPVFEQVAELFTEACQKGGKKLDRSVIANEVFSDPKKRERLEALVHPYVFEKIKDKIEASSREIVIVEIPLLFEAGFEVLCDKVIAVKCNYAVKRKRFSKRRFSDEEIRARERAQMPEALKIQKADFVLDNSNSIYQTRRDTVVLWTKLESLCKAKLSSSK
ncbi:MAG TPA: dephospho-CoA kinase [Candidatus Omnitrophota bacterium]|nr:dephospho-CoA kinase [Candidatus Omnitrophota bacterium]HPS36553.1 dephospho-CoA kinase [Candidatus Omnitrophota bacterium]